MQEYKRIDIDKEQIVPLAERMHRQGRQLVMIHGFINGDGQLDISYDYAVEPVIEGYHVVGETVLPWIPQSGCSCRRTCWRPRAEARSW